MRWKLLGQINKSRSREEHCNFTFGPTCNSTRVTICGGQKCGSSFGCVNAPRWRPTPIPHKHVNGRGRYMAAVCYTCYRPARTGYVRQSIALILALGARHCVYTGGRVRCGAGRIAFTACLPPSPIPLSSRSSPPLFAGTTSPSDYLHLVLRIHGGCRRRRTADAFTVRDRFLNLCGLSPRVIAKHRVLEIVARLMFRAL